MIDNKNLLKEYPFIKLITKEELLEVTGMFSPGHNIDFEKTWFEQGIDSLDLIDMVMYLEMKFDCKFNDVLHEMMFSDYVKPFDLDNYINQVRIIKLKKTMNPSIKFDDLEKIISKFCSDHPLHRGVQILDSDIKNWLTKKTTWIKEK